MFGIDTEEEIPKAYLTDHDAWDDYVGHLWHTLLLGHGGDAHGIIVEIGPGVSTKIGQALRRLDFEGTLYVVDASPKVLEILKPKYESLLPKAKMIWVGEALETCADKLPRNADFFLASHIIDDMLMHEAYSVGMMTWAEAYTHAPADELKKAWQLLENNPAKLKTVKGFVGETILATLRTLNPKNVVMSQYPSSALYDHGAGSLNDHAYAVMEDIKKQLPGLVGQSDVQEILSQNKHYRNTHLGEHVLNAKYWMLCQQK